MKLSPSEQDALIQLLTRIYMDIRVIEEEFHLLVGDHDFRPRIEYFHDAIRDFSSRNIQEREAGGRLSVELLAYDLNCLRYLQSMPLSSFKPHGDALSPSVEVMTLSQMPAVKTKRPDRNVRERLSELYQHYAVLFAALLKPLADSDLNERIRDLNEDVRDMSDIAQQLENVSAGKGSLTHLTTAVQHLEDDELRQLLSEFLYQQKIKKKDQVKKVVQLLKQRANEKDKAIATIEKAHMDYALAQLGIFEGAKDMLKQMASQGMNLVGKFVQNAMAEARRQMGR